MKLLVCGSRSTTLDYTAMSRIINEFIDEHGVTLLIEGCCKGSADEIAEHVASMRHFPIRHFPALPGDFFARDRRMVDDCDHVLAFWDGKSRGTAYTIVYAKNHKVPVTIISLNKAGGTP